MQIKLKEMTEKIQNHIEFKVNIVSQIDTQFEEKKEEKCADSMSNLTTSSVRPNKF